jgi:hypothetical protein
MSLQAGADADAREEYSGARPIHAAAAAQHRRAVELLLPRTNPEEGASSQQQWSVDALLRQAAEANVHGGCSHDHDHDHSHCHHHSHASPAEEGVRPGHRVARWLKGQRGLQLAIQHFVFALFLST